MSEKGGSGGKDRSSATVLPFVRGKTSRERKGGFMFFWGNFTAKKGGERVHSLTQGEKRKGGKASTHTGKKTEKKKLEGRKKASSR